MVGAKNHFKDWKKMEKYPKTFPTNFSFTFLMYRDFKN